MGLIVGVLITLLVICVIMLLSPNFITVFVSNVWGRIRRLKAHDPMDWRKTASSTSWNTGQYCSNCKEWADHESRMSDICSHCGSKKGLTRWRSARLIWDGAEWVVQFKYGDGPDDYEIKRRS